MVEFDLAPDEVIELVVEQTRDDVQQALNAHAPRGELVPLPDIPWPDDGYDHDEGLGFQQVTLLGSRRSRIELIGSGQGEQKVQLWNSWVVADAHHSWIGNSGIVCETLETPPGASERLRLWCSDGLGDPQFDDLVVVVTVGPRSHPRLVTSEEE